MTRNAPAQKHGFSGRVPGSPLPRQAARCLAANHFKPTFKMNPQIIQTKVKLRTKAQAALGFVSTSPHGSLSFQGSCSLGLEEKQLMQNSGLVCIRVCNKTPCNAAGQPVRGTNTESGGGPRTPFQEDKAPARTGTGCRAPRGLHSPRQGALTRCCR